MKKNLGFTLIELLVVISIISLLSSITLASLQDARAKARDTRRLEDLKQVHLALQLYIQDHGEAPPGRIRGCSNWSTLENYLSPKYIKSLPNDPLNCKGFTANAQINYKVDQSGGNKSASFRYYYDRLDTFFGTCRDNPNSQLCIKDSYALDVTAFEKRAVPSQLLSTIFGAYYGPISN